MITITITENSVTAEGHAVNPYVCNSISTLMWALVISLQGEEGPYSVREGNGFQHVEIRHGTVPDIIFRNFVKCFKEMSEQFPHEIKIVVQGG